jgi:hypothetical protein
VGAPLTGEDLYLTADDFNEYATAVLDTWEWIAADLDSFAEQYPLRHPRGLG